MLRSTLLALSTIAALAAGAAALADGGTGTPAPASAERGKVAGPTWDQLTDAQKDALSPLQSEWDQYDLTRKRKWVAIAARYQDLSPEGQQRMHERMPELAHLTPEQRKTARDNFHHAYSLPAEQRRVLTQRFQELPEEKKAELAEQSKKKPGPPPRRSNIKPAGIAPKATPVSVPSAPSAPATPVADAQPAAAQLPTSSEAAAGH